MYNSIYALVEQQVLISHCHSVNTDKSWKFLIFQSDKDVLLLLIMIKKSLV